MSMTQTTRRGLTDPERAAKILADIPDEPLDTQRRMNYFVTPRSKRLSEYEILTVYAQPNPDWISGGLDWGDWTQKFHGGRPSWGNESTELRTTDWYLHRDPHRRWHAPYVKDKAEEWRYTERFLEAYAAEGAVRSIDPYWRDEIINKYWGAFLFNEYGLFNAHSSVMRDCLSDVIRQTAGCVSFDKIDIAQMIQLERIFLAKIVPGFPESTDAPKKVWLTDPVYKNARTTVEEVWQGIQDWNEILWSAHAVYDSIFGQFVRRDFFGRLASAHGDTLTTFFIAQAQTYYQINKGGIQDLYLNCLASDPEFSNLNRRWLRAWTAKWLERTVEALRDFMGMYAKVNEIPGVTDKASVLQSVIHVLNDWKEDYAEAIGFQIDIQRTAAHIVSGLK